MRFREIREIKEIRPEKKREEDENFKKIKPEGNITFEEANDFWNNFWNNMAEEE